MSAASHPAALPLLLKYGFAPQIQTLKVRYRKMHPAQKTIRAEMKRFNTASLGRRFGKTFMAVDWLVEPAVDGDWHRAGMKKTRADLKEHGVRVAWFAPTKKMWEEVWTDVENLIGRHNIASSNSQTGRMVLKNGSRIDFWSLEASPTIRGRFYARVVVDEAAHVSDLGEKWEKVIRPTLSDLKGEAFFISTPNGYNFFRTVFEYGEDPLMRDWASWKMPTVANPFIDPQEIEDARETMSEDSFNQEHLGEFLRGGGKVFRNIEANLKSNEIALALSNGASETHTPEMHEGHRLISGVDWAQIQDFTCHSVACETCRCEVFIERFNQIEYEFQTDRVLREIERWRVSECNVEKNSIGQPNYESMLKKSSELGLKVKINAVQMTSESKPAMVEGLKLSLEKVKFQFLPDKTAANELASYEGKVSIDTGHIKYSAPKGGHDDTVVARMMMRRGLKKTGGFRRVRRRYR